MYGEKCPDPITRRVGSIAASDTWAEINFDMGADDAAPSVNDLIKSIIPAAGEIRRRLCERIRAVIPTTEILEQCGRGRGVWLAKDPDRRWDRRKVYGRAVVGAWALQGTRDEVIRSTPAEAFRESVYACADLMGEVIIEQVKAEMVRLDSPVVVRAKANAFGTYLSRMADGVIARVAFASDEYAVRLGAYYVITPPGDEINLPDEDPR